MKHILLIPFFCSLLCACGEPDPITQTIQLEKTSLSAVPDSLTVVTSLGLMPKNTQSTLDASVLSALLNEVAEAEFEQSQWTLGQGSELKIELVEYHFELEDSIDWVPGWFIPGFLPFGPVGFGWLWKDLKIQTPSLEAVVLARFEEFEVKMKTRVIRGVSDEESLSRVAFSEMVRGVREWLKQTDD